MVWTAWFAWGQRVVREGSAWDMPFRDAWIGCFHVHAADGLRSIVGSTVEYEYNSQVCTYVHVGVPGVGGPAGDGSAEFLISAMCRAYLTATRIGIHRCMVKSPKGTRKTRIPSRAGGILHRYRLSHLPNVSVEVRRRETYRPAGYYTG